ncbi:hypothetical protein DSECCO2_94770 [anaerobic digester metagenome]
MATICPVAQLLEHSHTHSNKLTMKITINLLFAVVFAVLSLGSTSVSIASDEVGKVTVIVDFGEGKKPKEIDVLFDEPLTALAALQRAATVETHPVGKYIIVTAIDGTSGERGVMAWYYKVNGESTGKVAYSQPVKSGDTITWIYTKDVCSRTVDCKKE